MTYIQKISLGLLVLLGVGGCESPECEVEAHITLRTPAPQQPLTGEFVLEGAIEGESKRRVSMVRVNGVPVMGTEYNYRSWRVVFSLAQLQAFASGNNVGTGDANSETGMGALEPLQPGHARLEVKATLVDVGSDCEVQEPTEVLDVRVALPEGSDPTGPLEVNPIFPDPPMNWDPDTPLCYAPSNGSEGVSIEVKPSEAADVGLRFKLSTTRGTLNPDPAEGLILVDEEGEMVSLQVVDGMDGEVTVTATAGTTSKKSEPILFAGPPTFPQSPASLSPGGSGLINIYTRGALAECWAETTAMEEMDGMEGVPLEATLVGGDDLLTKRVEFEDISTCGQLEGVVVSFPESTQPFSLISVTCIDVFGQQASHFVSAASPDTGGETGGDGGDEMGDGDGDGA